SQLSGVPTRTPAPCASVMQDWFTIVPNDMPQGAEGPDGSIADIATTTTATITTGASNTARGSHFMTAPSARSANSGCNQAPNTCATIAASWTHTRRCAGH